MKKLVSSIVAVSLFMLMAASSANAGPGIPKPILTGPGCGTCYYLVMNPGPTLVSYVCCD